MQAAMLTAMDAQKPPAPSKAPSNPRVPSPATSGPSWRSLSLALPLLTRRADSRRTRRRASCQDARHFRQVAVSCPQERQERWQLPEKAPKALRALRGTYYLNGLASCDQGGRLVHPFEAHGFMRSFCFHGDGSITYRGRFVETPCSTIERAAGRPLFRGVFSNVVDFGLPFGLLNALSPRTRETANLTCRLWPRSKADMVLLASGDNDTPMALDPETLATLGPAELPGLAGEKWLAHTRCDVARDRLVYLSISYVSDPDEILATRLLFHEYNSAGELVAEKSHRTSFMVAHDWTITENYYVVPKNPARFHAPGLLSYLAGLSQGTEVFRMAEDVSAELLLIPRCGGEPKEIPLDRFFNIFHMGPTYECGEKMEVHCVAFDRYRFGGEMGFDVETQDFDPIGWSASETNPPPHLHRAVLDLESGELVERRRIPLLDPQRGGVEVPVDMPTFHPLRDGQKARYCYFSGAARPRGWFPFRSLLKADLQSGAVENWDAGDGCIVAEPLFLPNGAGGSEWLGHDHEDDGWIVSVVHDGARGQCRLVVLDARRLAEGPVVELDAGPLSPWGVHSCWAPGTV
ncbi:unnamed protein product [Effrenium voratum]|nr:unnamed protein product [Effrenium voratum]